MAADRLNNQQSTQASIAGLNEAHDEFRAIFPVGSDCIFEEERIAVGPHASGIMVSCIVKHQPVEGGIDNVLIDCFDEQGHRIESFQVRRNATVIIEECDPANKRLKIASDSNSERVEIFRASASGNSYQKVLAFQPLDQVDTVPRASQALSALYLQPADVPTFADLYGGNTKSGTFWKVEDGWIYFNPEPWIDLEEKIFGHVVDPASRFALSLHEHSGTYVYPESWGSTQTGCVLDNRRLNVCSVKDWAAGKFDPKTQLRPGTRFVRLGFLINNWSGDPDTKPSAQGWTEGAAPFVWKSSPIRIID